ncbi:hypothetical protein [Streptomyces sp. NPDC005890]|uniref:hypothetical protein n=1 Tax=Streptomyces sp. NPDC005890 TaxID=3154568 RepID=UPI0034077ED3
METIRNWLLPLLLAAGQGALLWPGMGPRRHTRRTGSSAFATGSRPRSSPTRPA